MKKTLFLALTILASSICASATSKADKNKKNIATTVLTNQTDSISYAAGVNATSGLLPFLQQQYGVDTAHIVDFIKGFNEAESKINTPEGKAYIAGMDIAKMVAERIIPGTQEQEFKGSNITLDPKSFNAGFTAQLTKDTTIFTFKEAKDFKKDILSATGEKFLSENAKQPGIKILPDGLQYKVLTQGTGETPKENDECEVVYEGKLIDGTVFDSTKKHGSTTDKFRPGQVIKGWKEALCMMPVGSKWELYIPEELGYGERATGPIPAYSPLVFTVELVGITHPEEKKDDNKVTEKTESDVKSASKTTPTTTGKSLNKTVNKSKIKVHKQK